MIRSRMADVAHPPAESLDSYSQGALEPEAAKVIDSHLAVCESCRAVVKPRLDATVKSGRRKTLEDTAISGGRPSELSGPLPVGSQIGRYVVVGLLGQGGMGVVYAAFDPRLDRKVAVKLLRADLPQLEGMRERLVREAQALAKLRHPNVLAIHDAGDHGQSVFIAMEHVEGQTLTAWLTSEPRSTREVLGVFRDAGAGLSAAHRAGLVHRDFKPDNVLVGSDGTVWVADFGLARRLEHREAGAPAEGAPLASTVGLVGTPAYMGPEQLAGEPADARSDQFSFCVALWEALCGERPFAGDSIGALREATQKGQLRPVPPGRSLPRRIRSALERGLSPEPSARFPDMDALLAQLGRPARRGLGVTAAASALVLALVLGAAAAVRWTQSRREAPCAPDVALRSLWSPELAAPVAQRFTSSSAPYAAKVWQTAQGELDAWARSWAQRYAPVCVAAARERGAPDPGLHARLSCLERQAANFRALRADFAHADEVTIRRALDPIELLPTGDDCRTMGEYVEPPDPAQRDRFRALSDQLQLAGLLFEEGHYKAAADATAPVARAAHEAGFGSIEAEALMIRGRCQGRTGQVPEAVASLEASLRAAEASRRDSLVVIDRMELLELTITEQNDVARAEAMLPDLRASLDRVGSPASYEAEYQSCQAHLALLKGDDAAGLAALDRSMALAQQDHNLGGLTYANYVYDGAVALNRLGRFPEAQKRLDEALKDYRSVVGPQHPDYAKAVNLLASLHEQQGRIPEAASALQESMDVYRANHMDETPEFAISLNNLGLLQRKQGKGEAGAELIRKAIALSEKIHGPEAERADFMGGLAESLQEQHELPEALELASKAIVLKEKLYGASSPRLGMTLAIRAGILTDLHRAPDAVVDLKRSLALMNDSNSSPIGREVTRYELARASYDAGEKQKARQIAQEVRVFFAKQGEGFADNVAEVDTWLREHP